MAQDENTPYLEAIIPNGTPLELGQQAHDMHYIRKEFLQYLRALCAMPGAKPTDVTIVSVCFEMVRKAVLTRDPSHVLFFCLPIALRVEKPPGVYFYAAIRHAWTTTSAYAMMTPADRQTVARSFIEPLAPVDFIVVE